MQGKKPVLMLCVALFAGLGLAGTALALVGDLNIDGLVDAADMAIVSAAYGSHEWSPPSPNWDWRADVNQDGYVDLEDLTIGGRNYGETFNFHWPRRISNGRDLNPDLTNVSDLNAAVDSRGHVHIVWVEHIGTGKDRLYYTQLDAAGNTLVEDVLVKKTGATLPPVAVAVDSDDNAHIVWGGSGGAWYARLDPQGEVAVSPTLFCDGCNYPAVATDSYNHAHVTAEQYHCRVYYSILDSQGNSLLDRARLDTQFSTTSGGAYSAIAVDRFDTRHILWYEDTPGEGGDLVYTRIISGGLPSPNQITVTHKTGTYITTRLAIQADSQGAAHILWHDNSSGRPLGNIYWRRINPDGTLTDERLVTTRGRNTAYLNVRFVIDNSDRIHLVAEAENDHMGYGQLDRDGNVLVPFRTVLYKLGSQPVIALDADGNAVLAFEDFNCSSCPNPLTVMASLPDAEANDTSRADLVLDEPHTNGSPLIARIIDNATLTVTLTNGGWATANDVHLTFEETISGTAIPAAAIASLAPFSSTTVVRTFEVPDLEDATLLPIRISASTATTETTLTNNVVTFTMGILPPAHSVDFSVATYDESYVPDDRDLAAPLRGGQLTLEVPAQGYQAQVTSTNAYNCFIGVPLDQSQDTAMTTTIHLTLTAPGCSTATQVVTAARLEFDPYRVRLTPASPVKMYVNQWGIIHGTVYSGTSGTIPLTQTQVTLDSGAAVTVTDASGEFTFTHVISGSHSLETQHEGNEPTAINVSVQTGKTAMPAIYMPPTTKGTVRGTVTNDMGRSFGGVNVKLKSGDTEVASATTDTDGHYVLEVDPVGSGQYHVTAEATLCDSYTGAPFYLQAGVRYVENFTLHWTKTAAGLTTSSDVVSWEQKETWNKVNDDDLSVGLFVQSRIAKLKNHFKSYEVDVGWGMYHYSLGLNYSEAGSTKTVENLSVDLTNKALYSYDVSSGRYHAGAENVDRTALRVDRVDLVTIDSVGNVQTTLWSDSQQWYAASPDETPTWRPYLIETQTPDWSTTAVRIFLRVGQYTSSAATSHWSPWHPPVSVASLAGSGSGAGADYQCIIWRLSGNDVEIIKSLAYYADVVSMYGVGMANPPRETMAPLAKASRVVSLTFPSAAPAHVGIPFAVDVTVGGMDERPVYGLEFDLDFNRNYLQVLDVMGAPDFEGPYGTWTVKGSLTAINAQGKITDTAIVRLGATDGIAEGAVARIIFLPLAPTGKAHLDLHGVYLADQWGRTFTASATQDADLQIEPAPQATYSVSGRVHDVNGNAFADVPVWAGPAHSGVTDAAGLYTITDLLSITYTVNPALSGYAFWPATRSVTLPPDAGEQDFTILPGSVSTRLFPREATRLTYTDTQGLPTTLDFPAGAVTGTTTIVLTPTLAQGGANFVFAGHAFEIEAFRNGNRQPGFVFGAPATVTIHYSDQDVHLVSDESQLALWWWTGSEWRDAAQTCDPASSYTRDVVNNVLSVPICHLSEFGLFGPTHRVYLPLVLRTF